MPETINTKGILLKITWLANDDAVLDFFTEDVGRVPVFVSKLARSKKRQLELDFFRLLELGLDNRRGQYKLKSVTTLRWFGALQSDYTITQNVFRTLESFRVILPEEKDLPAFYDLSINILSTINAENANCLLALWEVAALECSGVCPRFDSLRGDVWWQFESFELFDQKVPHSIEVPHLVRQVLEFLRRSDLNTIIEKSSALPQKELKQALKILQEVALHH